MTRLLRFPLTAAFALGFTSVALASPPTKVQPRRQTRATTQNKTIQSKTALPQRNDEGALVEQKDGERHLTFGLDDVEGELLSPNELNLRGRPPIAGPNLITIRTDFISEMLRISLNI